MRTADLFCGGGGWSEGLKQACQQLNIAITRHSCINHWGPAINTHRANHPYAQHFCDKLDNVHPSAFGTLDGLIASPPCTEYSTAKGGKPSPKQSRTEVQKTVEYIESTKPEWIAIENVPAFALHKKNRREFRQLIDPLTAMGYNPQWKVLNCADYGDPTTRERLFILGRKDGQAATFPEPTHAKNGANGLKPWIPAKDIIDWSLKGRSIFNRPGGPLSPTTLRRIEAGIRKFWGDFAEPFCVLLKGGTDAHIEASNSSISDPLPTICAKGQHHMLIEPEAFIVKYHGQRGENDDRTYSIREPLKTVDCSNRYGLCEPFIIQYYGNNIEIPSSINSPLPTVTCKDRFGIVQQYGLDILYRMFQPRELAAATGFPANYFWYGNKTQTVRQVGNAVPVNTARHLLVSIISQTMLEVAA